MFVTSAARPHALPPPLWQVTNGRSTVGPVPTAVVRRGFETGHISTECSVRAGRDESWRAVTTLRELRPKRPAEEISTLEVLLRMSESIHEVMTLGLELAMERTGSSVGVLHRFDAPEREPILHASAGAALGTEADRTVGSGDPFRRVAELNRVILAGAEENGATLELAERLGGTAGAAGVATAPILHAGRVRAMMQLARPVHRYRATDALVLAEVAKLVAQRLDVIA